MTPDLLAAVPGGLLAILAGLAHGRDLPIPTHVVVWTAWTAGLLASLLVHPWFAFLSVVAFGAFHAILAAHLWMDETERAGKCPFCLVTRVFALVIASAALLTAFDPIVFFLLSFPIGLVAPPVLAFLTRDLRA